MEVISDYFVKKKEMSTLHDITLSLSQAALCREMTLGNLRCSVASLLGSTVQINYVGFGVSASQRLLSSQGMVVMSLAESD
jgi:hypothetical protein